MLIPVLQVHQPITIQPQINNPLIQAQHVQPKNTVANSHRNYLQYFNSTKFNFRAELRKELKGIKTKLQMRGLSFANLQIMDRIRNSQPDVELKIVQPKANVDPDVILFNKDEARLSDRSYIKFRKTAPSWPSIRQARQFREHLRLLFPITKTEYGVYNSPSEKITKMFDIHRHQIHYEFNGTKIIQIKLSADGAQIGKKCKILNFTFSFLHQINMSKFVDGNFTLGIFDYDLENYETVNTRFRELLDELASLKSITIVKGNVTENFDIEFFFAADKKCSLIC